MSETKRTGAGPLLAKLAISLMMTALLFAVIEYAAGFLLLSREAVSGGQASEDDTVSATLAWLWINPAPLREDPDFLWVNQPGAHRTQFINPKAYGSTAQWTIENNSRGFRGPEIQAGPPADDVYRILCIGDSVTFGFNSDQEDSYPAQLEQILRSHHPGKKIEVINAGVPGWTWLQGVRFLKRRGLALKPDLVLMAHGVNDQLMRSLITDAERLEHTDDRAVKRIAELRLLVGETNTYRVIEQTFDKRSAPVKPSPGCRKQIKKHGGCKRVSPEQIEEAVIKAAELTRSSGIKFIVLNLDFMKTPAVEAVRKGTQAQDILLVDLVHQLEFERGLVLQRRSDDLGLIAAGDRASEPMVSMMARRRRIVFRVRTPDSDAPYSARGRAIYYFNGTFEFNILLNDEGRDGDERAADGVFSGTLTLPRSSGVISYMFFREEAPEFESLPPLNSSFGDRQLHVNDILIAPISDFAKRFGMAEQTHPNANGNEMVAKAVAFEIEKLQSFRR